MKLLIALLVAGCGGSSFESGASMSLDGMAIGFDTVAVVHADTFFDLTASAPEGTLAIAFPDDAEVGTHACNEGQAVGLFTIDFTTELGIKFATYFPASNPMDDCTFDLTSTGSEIVLEDINATLVSSDGIDTLSLTAGHFAGEAP